MYVLGKDLLIKEGAKALAGATSCDISIDAEVIDTTKKGDGDWASNMAGLKSWNITTDALFSVAEFAYIEKVGTTAEIEVTVGEVTYQGSAIINSLSISSQVKGVTTYKVTLTGTGGLTKKVA